MERPKRLSAAFVRSVEVPGRYGDGWGGHGLSLLVKTRRGGGLAKSWAQRVRINGKATNVGLGAYPVVTLAEARDAALANRREIAQGRDPRTTHVPVSDRAGLTDAALTGAALTDAGLTERAASFGFANGHNLLDERRHRIHTAIADKIDADPSLLAKATANLARWTNQRSHMERGYVEWAAILKQPWPEVASLLRSRSEDAIRLRQCSPFAGVLSERERMRIYDTFGA